MPKNHRKTDPTARLSEQMKEVLLWVYSYEPPEPEPQLYSQTATGELVVSTDRLVNSFAPWRPSVFIGENPTPSKTTALSNTLKRLEERGLLNRYSFIYKNGVMVRLALLRGKGKRMRTTHVNLTRNGAMFVESLKGDFNLEEYEKQREQRKLGSQVVGLGFASKLLYREQLRLMEERDSSAEMLQDLERLNNELGEMTIDELEQRTRQALSAVREAYQSVRDRQAVDD